MTVRVHVDNGTCQGHALCNVIDTGLFPGQLSRPPDVLGRPRARYCSPSRP